MMKHSIVLAAIVLLSGIFTVANAQDRVGVRFFNGLPETITDAQAAFAEQCDVFKCGEWRRRSQQIVPMPPNAVADVIRLHSTSPDATSTGPAKVVCVYDLKIVTESDEEHVFRGFNFCTPNPSTVSFEKPNFGVVAIQEYKDDQDQLNVVIFPSQNVIESAAPAIEVAE